MTDLGIARTTAIGHLDRLIDRGRRIEGAMRAGAAPPSDARRWQEDCASAVADLSGGRKAHWLAREFSDALLVRSPDGSAAVEAEVVEIVRRLLNVLAQARLSLTLSIDDGGAPDPALPRRFEFVHNRALRPVLERAFAESGDALDRREFERSLVLSSGAIEALITDALEHALVTRCDGGGDRPSREDIARWSFDERVAAAQRLGLLRNGCARLPAAARQCREWSDGTGAAEAGVVVTERDARVTHQVLHVVMRDLDPGR